MNVTLPSGRERLSWQDYAACLEFDPDLFFPERGGSSRTAKAVCEMCIVRRACLRYALESREAFGIWGGASERDRRKLRKVGGP